MKKILNNKKGFTLAELLIVIAIIAILAAIAVPVYANVVEKANQAKDRANVELVYRVFLLACAETGYGTDGTMEFVGGGKCTYNKNGNVGGINPTLKARMNNAFGVDSNSASNYYKMPAFTSKLYTAVDNPVEFQFKLLKSDGTLEAATVSGGKPFSVEITRQPVA